MTIATLRDKIITIYAGLTALVTAGKITEADKTALGPVIIAALLSREAVED